MMHFVVVDPHLTPGDYFPNLQVIQNSETGEPRYIGDGYELEGFELPVRLPSRLCRVLQLRLGQYVFRREGGTFTSTRRQRMVRLLTLYKVLEQ